MTGLRIPAAAAAYLDERRADDVPHLDATLRPHLENTFAMLQEWGNPPHVCLAGLFHAIYGTDGFDTRLAPPTDRDPAIAAIGDRAERLVYFYAACDRRFLYPRLAEGVARRTGLARIFRRNPRMAYRDRFRGDTFAPDIETFANFLELTVANELEILRRWPTIPESTVIHWRGIFDPCREWLSRSAKDAIDRYL